MSLIHWWSLNGNLKDYGLKQSNLSSSGTTTNANGKIGKCYKLTDSNKITGAINDFNYANTSISMGGWFKFNKAEISSVLTSSIVTSTAKAPTGNLIGNNNYGGFGLVWEANDIYTSGSFSSLRVYPYLRRSSQSIYLTTSAFTVTFDTWYHFMVTLDIVNRKVSFYVNGTLHSSGTYNVAIEYESHEYYLNVGWVGGGNGPGKSIPFYVNDVRMYDHALSVKEVKEISKGLVLHYTFEDAYAEGTTNLFAGRTDFSNTSHWPRNQINSTAPTVDSEGDMKLYGYATDGNHQSYTFSKNAGYTSISASTTYTLSVWVKYSSTSAYFNMYFYEQNSGGTATKTNSWRIGCTSEEVGHWVLRSKTVTTQSTTTRMYAELNCYNCPASDYIIMKNNSVQLEQKDHATPFVNGTRPNGLIYDSSGYGRSATPVNNPQILNDSSSGLHCVDLTNASNGYYDLGTGTFNFITSGTVCFWAKYSDSNYKMILGANDSGSKYLAANTPNGSSSSGNWYGMVSTSNCYCDGEVYSKPKIDSQWHFYCFTGINFSSWGDLKYFLCIYANNPNNSFQFHGYLADFKIYATALSASDILVEYQTKASIDRDGNLYTGEFVEDNDRINIAKTDVVKASVFEEGTSLVKMTDKYVELEYIQSDGNQWMDSNVSITANLNVYCKIQWTNISGSYPMLYGAWSIFSLSSMPSSKLCIASGGYSGNNPWSAGPSVSANVIYHIKHQPNKLTINNVLYTIPNAGATNNASARHVLLFAASNTGNTPYNWSTYCKAKMYRFEIYDGLTQVRNFIPAKRKSDNVVGLYDTVNRQFYTNSGSGSFTAGPEKGNLSIVYSKQIIEN